MLDVETLAVETLGTVVGTALTTFDHWAAVLPLLVLWLAVSGRIGRGAGFDDLFRDDDHIVYVTDEHGRLDRARWRQRRGWWSTLVASPAFWSTAGLAMLGGLAWARVFRPMSGGDAGWPYLVGTLSVVVVFVWAAARLTLRRPRLDVGARPSGDVRAELFRVVLGGALGAAGFAGLYWLSLEAAAAPWAPEALGEPMPWLNGLMLVSVAAAFRVPYLVSGLAVVALVIGLMALLGLIGAATGTHGEIAALAVGGLLIWSNGTLFKGRVPGLDYDRALKPSDDAGEVTNPNESGGLPQNPAKIPLVEPLERWLDSERRAGREKPVLTILATSGGAYRASFWTALVLDRLSAEAKPGGRFEGLPESIRLIAGASGGMVAGAYFTALSHRDGKPPTDIASAIAQDTVRFQRGQGTGPLGGRGRRLPIPRDSLSPVVQQMIRHDLPAAFLPWARKVDRGVMLDQQWRALQYSFADIATSEANARCPSIIFSPMLIETGSVVYASNLDLRPMRLTRLHPGEGPSAVNDNSVELLDACPEAWHGLTLATATRLNATFPYVSPALSLPVVPNRRVVDSGYYDNYGGDVIAGWLATPEVRDWICANCSGVAILQVRAFRRDDALESRPGRVGRAFQGITSPPEGLFSARAASQLLRNNQQLKLVEQLYEAYLGRPMDEPQFIRRFVFEALADASMSWYLPDGELESLRRLLPDYPGFSLESDMPPIATDNEADGPLARRRAAYVAQQKRLEDEIDALAAFWSKGAEARMRESMAG
jgi:hypothetical protein